MRSDNDIMPLICLRCRKDIPLPFGVMKSISYTHYSYCEECLRKGLKALRKEPSTDAVTREAVFDLIIWIEEHGVLDARKTLEEVRKLPSVIPMREEDSE